jgi:ABC-type multidrug transport system fused ATPase/permease subunit
MLLGSAAVLVIVAVGAPIVQADQMAAAELVMILLYAQLMMSPLGTLADTYGQVQTVRGASERIIAFLQHTPESGAGDSNVLSGVTGEILLENVAFAYPGRAPLFSNLSMHIAAGQTVALTGKNGSGKSTIAALLTRFAQPQAGRILFDGIDIAAATLPSVRATVGLVAQRVLLVNGTIAQNIAYGRPQASKGEIQLAAQRACAHEFIQSLPQGYDTVVGDEGIRLSGGQRQRVSLARTLLCDPPILILDEATAMFDPAGERAFLEDCKDLLADKTVILITHRPESLVLADRVLCIEAGCIVEKTALPRDTV